MSKKKMITGPVVGLLSSVLAFLGMISVCGFPMLAAFLAWFGIGASQLNFLSEYQTFFTVMALIALLYGFYTIYIKQGKGTRSNTCDSNANEQKSTGCEMNAKSKWFAKTLLWLAAFAVVGSFYMNKADQSGKINKTCSPVYYTSPSNATSFQGSPCVVDTIIQTSSKNVTCTP